MSAPWIPIIEAGIKEWAKEVMISIVKAFENRLADFGILQMRNKKNSVKSRKNMNAPKIPVKLAKQTKT